MNSFFLRKQLQKVKQMKKIFEVADGKIIYMYKENGDEEFYNDIIGKTMICFLPLH